MSELKVVDINKVEPEKKTPPRSSWILISEKTVGAQNLALGVNETEPGSMVPEHTHETEEEGMFGRRRQIHNPRSGDRPKTGNMCLQPTRSPAQNCEYRHN